MDRIVLNFMREDYQAESAEFNDLQLDLDTWLNDKVSPDQERFRVILEPVNFDGHDAYRFSIYTISAELSFHPLYSTVLAFAEGFFCGRGFVHYTVETYL